MNFLDCRPIDRLGRIIGKSPVAPGYTAPSGTRIILAEVLTFTSTPNRIATVDVNGNGTTDYTVDVVCAEDPIVGEGLWIADLGSGRWIGIAPHPSHGVSGGGGGGGVDEVVFSTPGVVIGLDKAPLYSFKEAKTIGSWEIICGQPSGGALVYFWVYKITRPYSESQAAFITMSGSYFSQGTFGTPISFGAGDCITVAATATNTFHQDYTFKFYPV